MFKPAVALFQDSGIFFRILDLFLRMRGETDGEGESLTPTVTLKNTGKSFV